MKKPSRVTLVEVARHAGVSPATVSNAVNRARYVDSETRKRIDRAIAELGYIPNLGARRLRTGKANAIAVFSSMPFTISGGPSRLGFMMEIAASAAVAALEKRLALVLVPPLPVNDPGFGHVEADGALVIEPAGDDPYIAELARRGVPIVAIGRPGSQNGTRAIPHVDLQPKVITGKTLGHFAETGARAPALFVGMTDRAAYHEAETAYRQFAREHRIDPTVRYLDERLGERAGYDAAADLLRHHPEVDAIFVLVDTFASGVVQALNEQGIDMPGRMRLATRYDGIRARESTPRLTAFNLHLDTVARLALDRLLQEIDGQDGPLVVTGPTPEIVPRESSVKLA